MLDHVPADDAEIFIVAPIQTLVDGAIIVGLGFTFSNCVVFEHPVEVFVNVKETLPCARAVIAPVFISMVATVKLLLTHVPVTEGVTIAFAVPPAQITGADNETTGLATTATGADGAEEQPVEVSVQINVAEPTVRPVTIPELFITAIVAFDVAHVPPVLGSNCVVVRIQIVSAPFVILGEGLTGMLSVSEIQPVDVSVNTNLAVPAAKPVTSPPFVTEANTVVLCHVPPVLGVNVVVEPIQTSGVPLTVTVGLGFTVTGGVVAEHPVAELVKVNVAEPCVKPVTTPLPESTDATKGAFDTQVPPEFGDNVVVELIHIEFEPDILTVGLALTTMFTVSAQDVVEYAYL